MLTVRSNVKFSPIHGMGCFASEDIKKGETVWRFDPSLDPVIKEKDFNVLLPAVQEFLRIYTYSQLENGEKVYVLCGDHARYMNHSDDPNLLEGAAPGESTNIAARDIKAGEELTCNYLDFDLDAKFKLSGTA